MKTLRHYIKIFPVILLCFFANGLNAQIAIEWQKSFGGTGNDVAYSLEITSDGGYVIAGNSNSTDGDVSGNHGGWDIWIIKLENDGNIGWEKCFGGSGDDYANSVQQTTDGGYIVAGYSNSNDGDVSGNHGSSDYWVVKLDSSGNLLWQKSLGGTLFDYANSVQQTFDGGYIVAGLTTSNDGDVSGNHGNYDFWVVKLDSSGSIQWQKCYGGSNYDNANSVQQTFDGGYVVTGISLSNDGDVTGNHGVTDYWTVKLDGNGNIQWQKCLGGSSGDYALSVQQTSDGGYVIAGYSSSNDGDVSGNQGQSDYWLVKLDGNGNVQWQRSIGGASQDIAYSVKQLYDDGYILAGRSASNDGDVSGNQGVYDYWIVRLDSFGFIQWQRSLGGTNNDFSFSAQNTADGGYVVAGHSNSNDGDVTGNHGDNDYWVVKLTEHYNSITGKLFADLNSNNTQDSGEPVLANKKVTEQNTGRFGFSGLNGEYSVLVLDSGNYNVTADPLNHFTPAPSIHNASFTAIQQTDSLNDFAFQPNGVVNDLCITITPATLFRQGMNATYVIKYENVGTTTINNCSVIFFPHNLVSYVGSNVTPFSVAPDSVVWNVGTLTPFQAGSIVVTVNVQLGTPIGTTINSGARIEPVAGDANPNCNTNYWEVVTTGAIDPNDILVNRATLFTTEFPNPPFLEYLIRFQNVGNDTAFTVRIFNPIDTNKLEINSLEFVASSHPVDMQYVFHERYMKFTFNNILLVDSTTNEPMSHGFVRYKIKPKSNLVVNDSILNSATIHFDFEAPVLTNTALTTIESPTSLPAMEIPGKGTMQLWPNPAKETLNVGISLNTSSEITIDMLNIFGQTVATKKAKGVRGENKLEMSVEELPAGVYVIRADVGGKLIQMKVVKL